MARRDITGAIDFGYLGGYCAGDEVLMDEVLGLFLEQVELWGRLLDPGGDPVAWRDGAHTLKGSAVGIGAHEVGRICAEAEAAAGEPAAVKGALKHRLEYALDLAGADIAAWRHEMALKGLK
jgi:Hpt domain